MNHKTTILAWLLLFFLVTGCQSAALFGGNRSPDPEVAGYGEKVRFAEGHPIRFPDFTLTYLGQRHVASETFPRGFDYHDFQIGRAAEGFTVSWSSGTGDIGPTMFELSGQTYRLELRYADTLGTLADDEVVITPE